MTHPSPFLTDILSQPQGLVDVISGYEPEQMRSLWQRLAQGDFDRVVITGMGASYFATYPAWLLLAQAGVPAYWIETSELLYYTPGIVTPRTLLWVVSNSGKSIEITRLLNRLPGFGSPFVLANTNSITSPLAEQANQVTSLLTGSDLTLATRSYIGTLAVTQLMALNMLGKDIRPALADLRVTAKGLHAYTARWEEHLKTLGEQIGQVERMAVIGRGPSYGTALESALAFKEGPKFNAEGLSMGQFWHGPVELTDERYTLLVMGGEAVSRREDAFLARRAAELGARVLWFCKESAAGLTQVTLPVSAGIGLPMAEILPVQLLCIHLSRQTGFSPDAFRYINSVVSLKDEAFPG